MYILNFHLSLSFFVIFAFIIIFPPPLTHISPFPSLPSFLWYPILSYSFPFRFSLTFSLTFIFFSYSSSFPCSSYNICFSFSSYNIHSISLFSSLFSTFSPFSISTLLSFPPYSIVFLYSIIITNHILSFYFHLFHLSHLLHSSPSPTPKASFLVFTKIFPLFLPLLQNLLHHSYWFLCPFSGLGNRTFANSHIAHFCSFQKCDCALALFVAFFKSVIVRSHFLSHF